MTSHITVWRSQLNKKDFRRGGREGKGSVLASIQGWYFLLPLFLVGNWIGFPLVIKIWMKKDKIQLWEKYFLKGGVCLVYNVSLLLQLLSLILEAAFLSEGLKISIAIGKHEPDFLFGSFYSNIYSSIKVRKITSSLNQQFCMLSWSWGQIGKGRSGYKTKCMKKDLFFNFSQYLLSPLQFIFFFILVANLISESSWTHKSVHAHVQKKKKEDSWWNI